ncbi:hypothetical protein HYC85_005591 [Camellia sinensis]|uniref:Uncharacterized protein n=1 Tax=Camellia sinensis TaxID=4442 RepID=A0A7J7I1R7_CAMSI|nr:hypothetical protein HYC85_005591 [Camellia sinensis]
MSPPLLGVEGKYRGNDSVVAASASMDCISQNGSGLKEHNYLRLSDCSLEDSSRVSSVTQVNKSYDLVYPDPNPLNKIQNLLNWTPGNLRRSPCFLCFLQKTEFVHHLKRLLFQGIKEVSLTPWIEAHK